MSKDVDMDWLMVKSNFMRTYCNDEIADDDIELIFNAIQHPKDDMIAHKRQSDEIERELNKCPTREELGIAIEDATKGKAGGPTGATYNMLKLATKEMIEDIYIILVELWENNLEIADFWQNRWLKAVPKNEDNLTAENTRPIMLIEVTRKLWMGILMKKNRKALEEIQHHR